MAPRRSRLNEDEVPQKRAGPIIRKSTLNNTQLAQLYDSLDDDEDKRETLFHNATDFFYPEQARKDGTWGKPTHIDDHKREYRIGTDSILEYRIPKSLTRKVNKGDTEYVRHPDVDEILNLKPVKDVYDAKPLKVIVVSNRTEYKNICGTLDYKIVVN